MKYCSSIDTDDILFKIVSEAVTSGKVVINGGVFTQGERPDDSEAEDIVINTITVTHDKPQTGTSNVNIYAKDLKLRIKGKEQRKADRERLRTIGNALVAYLDTQNIADLEYWIESDIVIKELEVNQHYRNIRISWNIH
ncbi:hypothetical protein [Bacteroides eggerthii]|jgi:hypothetical protein|uniref:hypothetical protein n=1 Tax=Bacteroides TaxID=816 RepID=UPI00397A7002